MMSLVKRIFNIIRSLPSHYKEWRKREKRMSYGEDHPDKIFYIISYDYDTQGLFAIVKSVLSHIMYAIDKGWIPVVDLKNNKSQYKQGDENTWELFFEQPCGYGLDDIRSAKHIIKSYYGLYPYNKYAFHVNILDSIDAVLPYSEAYKRFIRPSVHAQKVMDGVKEKLRVDDKTIGVLCRGTDYISRRPHNHPIQPSPENVITDVREYMLLNGYDKVFVATEDSNVLDMFKREFGESLRYIDQPRLQLSVDQQYLSEITVAKEKKLKMALDYYTALYILSKCPVIIAGRTAGTLGAVMMSDGFKYSHFYDLGYYE